MREENRGLVLSEVVLQGVPRLEKSCWNLKRSGGQREVQGLEADLEFGKQLFHLLQPEFTADRVSSCHLLALATIP